MKPNNSTKAILLCRVSSDKQAENYSLPVQERLGREYADKNGLEVTEVFSFVESASAVERRQFNELYARVASGQEQHLLAMKANRLTRRLSDVEKLRELVTIHDKKIHFFGENLVVHKGTTPGEWFRLMITCSSDVFYVLDLSEKTKRGMNEKALQGDWPTAAPLGYRNNKETKLLDVDEEMKPWIVQIHKLAAKEHSIDAIKDSFVERDALARFREARFR